MNIPPEPLATTLRYVRRFADDEGLIEWTPDHIAGILSADVDEAPTIMRQMVESGWVLPYRGGRPQRRLAYLIGSERAGGASDLPPPSIQNGATLTAYRRRDGQRCHLCGFGLTTGVDWRRAWPSLDHVIPRKHGGTDYPSNIRVAHVSCNKARRDRPASEFAGSPLSRVLAGRR